MFKKILIAIGIILICIVLWGCWTLSVFEYPDPIDKKSLAGYYEVEESEGGSMTEFGFPEGSHDLKVYPNKSCKVGDICVFKCLSEKCINPDSKIKRFHKKLESIDANGCYYFVGNSEPWIENGVSVKSWDSRSYGPLCQGEFSIKGLTEINQ